MPTQDNDHRDALDELSPLEHAVLLLLKSVLHDDEQRLLAAFNVIADPTVRQALIDLARAAAGFPDLLRGEPPSPAPPSIAVDYDPYLRRIRRHLRLRGGKGGHTP